MFRTRTRTKRFDLMNNDHLDEYSAIVNNPSCVVLEERKHKHTEKLFCEGKVESIEENEFMVITWQEKELA